MTPAMLMLVGEVEDQVRHFVLRQTRQRIGSQSGSEILLETPEISRHHAVIQVVDGVPQLEDLASKNGTFANGERVSTHRLCIGDRLRFANLEFTVEAADPADHELAIVLGEEGDGAPLSGDTASQFDSGDASNAEGMRYLDAFLRALGAPGESRRPDLSAGLAGLTGALGSTGACFFDLPQEGGELQVRGAAGALGELPGAELREVAVAPSRGPVALRQLPNGGPFVAIWRPAAFGLVLWGSPPSPPRPLPRRVFFGALLQLAMWWAPPRTRVVEDATTSPLVLPAGHVRGTSAAMEAVYRQLQSMASSDLPVLVIGETGVGKEGIARIVHASSHRARGPFVAINCGAIPGELLEAELFGIAAGVATGVTARPGRFLEASGGTLFLDEIGDMPAALQVKLLRALQEQVVQPLGRAPVAIDVRMVSATNADLEEHMSAGRLRRDLYYRLAGLVLHLPPLRQRREDVPALVEHFLRRATTEAQRDVRGLTLGALRRLTQRDWPGNVRQLEHEIHRLVYSCPEGQAIDLSLVEPVAAQANSTSEEASLANVPGPDTTPPPTLDAVVPHLSDLRLATAEGVFIAEALERAGGNLTQAAKLLGLSRQALRRRMDRLDLGAS